MKESYVSVDRRIHIADGTGGIPMSHIRLYLRKLGEVKLGMLIAFIGILMGVLFAKLFRGLYWSQIDILNKDYFETIKNTTIDHSVLLQYVMWKNFRIFVLFWIFSATAFGIAYIAASICYGGFQIGFFVSVILMKYHLKGLLLIVGYTFPHSLIYIPLALLCLRSGYWMCHSMYYDSKLSKRGKVERIAKQLILIIILGAVLMIGGLLETYPGSFLLKKILQVF